MKSTQIRYSDALPCITAGFVAVLVGFTSTAVIVFQAAQAASATPAQISSWIAALCGGMALTGIFFSLKYKAPLLTAWSTPGAALLSTSLIGYSMNEAVGGFILSALLITLFGITGWFEKMMERLPLSLASALLAGVLFRFGLDTFNSMSSQFGLVLPMFIAYLLFKRDFPRYVMLAVLILGTLLAYWKGTLKLETISLATATLDFQWPTFSLSAFFSVSLPLFVVTMASQNIPGAAAIRAAGYHVPLSPLITGTGLMNILLAPFGGFSFNLAAITATICMGKEAHEDPKKRYLAAIAAGGFYLIVGLFGATVASVFAAFPKELVSGLAGIALLGPIGASLAAGLKEDRSREAALITFLMTASGFSLFGIGSAFWGMILGALALFIATARRRPVLS